MFMVLKMWVKKVLIVGLIEKGNRLRYLLVGKCG